MIIRVKITRDGSKAVRKMDIEEYLRGVVPSEIPISSPPATLQAQAIAARTFAAKAIQRNRSKPFDVDDTTAYQAYRLNYSAPATDAAIQATTGIVLTYNGGLIDAVYSASNGGKTTSAKQRWGNEIAYLPSKPDPYDARSGYTKFGHGVGLSQRGAQQAAREGLSCADILAFYYPGAAVAEDYGAGPASKPSQESDAVEYAVCTGKDVNIRTGPGTRNRSLGKLDRGDKLLVFPETGGWHVAAARVGSKIVAGYVSAEYVRVVSV